MKFNGILHLTLKKALSSAGSLEALKKAHISTKLAVLTGAPFSIWTGQESPVRACWLLGGALSSLF